MLQSVPEIEPANPPIRVHILANPNYAIDGVVDLLTKQSGLFQVQRMEPHPTICVLDEQAIDVLMVHENITSDSLEQYVKDLHTGYPDLPILLLGHTVDEDYLFNMVRAGIRGYVTGPMNSDDLIRAVEEVSQGKTWIGRWVMQQFITTNSEMERVIKQQCSSNVQSLASQLTKRETEILGKVLEGLRTKEIADQVNLSHQGVKVHLGKLFRKFNVNNRSQLILSAINKISPVENLFDLVRDALNDHHTSMQVKRPAS